MRRNRRKNIYLFLFILVCSLGIGYAFLRTELSINGTADFLDARWDIHFNNLVVNPDSVELSTGNTAATISASTTEVTYAVTLNEPGDFYEFTVDAVNAGNMDAMIETITSKMGGANITTLPTYMEYSVTYNDGVELAPNQYLKAGTTEIYKVHIGFNKEISASDLTGQVENKTFSFSVTYVQADENAVEVLHPSFADDDWETVINRLKTGNIEPYEIGDEKEVNLEIYGKHILRIANASTPAECSTAGFSQTACGVVLEFADVVTTYEMNPNGEYQGITYQNGWNVDGWPASVLRTYVNNNIYNALPNVIKNAIIDTTVVSGHGSTTGETNFTSTDKIYLLSPHEVWEDVDGDTSRGIDYNDTAYGNTRQLDYYYNLGTSFGGYSSSSSSYIGNFSPAVKNKGSTPSYWWLRSAYFNSISDFSIVIAPGHWGGQYASLVSGVSPAFRIA